MISFRAFLRLDCSSPKHPVLPVVALWPHAADIADGAREFPPTHGTHAGHARTRAGEAWEEQGACRKHGQGGRGVPGCIIRGPPRAVGAPCVVSDGSCR